MAPEAAYTVNLAIDGLLSNTIGHGYDDEAHRIIVNVRLEVASLVVAFVDDGAAFDPTRMPEQDIETLLGNRDPGEFCLLLVNWRRLLVQHSGRGDSTGA